MRHLRRQVVYRWVAALGASSLATLPAIAGAAPPSPTQERMPDDHPAAAGPTAGGLDVLVAADDIAGVASELDELQASIAEHLDQLDAAELAMTDAVNALVDADVAVSETERRIEALTIETDKVVVNAFMSPPAEHALDVLATPSVADATLKHAVLGIQADATAEVLAELDRSRGELEERQAAQEQARRLAESARADAETALAGLEDAVSQQGQFMMALTHGLDAESAEAALLAATDPALAAQLAMRRAQLSGKLEEMRAAQEYAEALAVLAEAERREAERREAEEAAQQAQASDGTSGGSTSATSSGGGIVCPVQGAVSFTDTWGAARSGGRTHKGVDMMAAMGTPTVAPVSGRVEHRSSSLGGLSWYVYGDDGHTYYGTHLSGYANRGAGWVAAGAVIGYVGDSGNAAGTPHLHFEYHPGGGSPVNPYPLVAAAC
jgi:murein DD-endopeptidase MepM/ murein hydrolase activator NlpD